MVFFASFIVCGVLCTLCQLAKEVFKANDGQVAVGVMALGALLVPTGLIAYLEASSQMGVMVTCMDAAASICKGATALANGDFSGGLGTIAFVLGIFVGVTVIGYVAGALYDLAHRGKVVDAETVSTGAPSQEEA